MSDTPQERTDDAMYRGAVRILQHRKGYRFSFDAVLLAHEVARGRPQRGVEFCAGSGVVSLCVAHLLADYRGRAYEVQPALAALAAENVVRNGFAERIEVAARDVRTLEDQRQGAVTVFLNPPYFGPGEGTESPNRERAIARHQAYGTLRELLVAAARVAGDGEVVFVYPGEREAQALAAAADAGFAALRLRRVRTRPGAAPAFLIVRGTTAGTSCLETDDETLLFDDAGEMTPAHRAIVDGLLPPALMR